MHKKKKKVAREEKKGKAKKEKTKKTKREKTKKAIIYILIYILFRYLIAILFGFAIPIFYYVFTPLTLFFLSLVFSIFSPSILNNSIIISNYRIDIIPACIAGSAYYLLFVLNLLTPNISTKRRFLVFLFSSALFFFLNSLRLFFLILLLINGIEVYFYHKAFWYLGSTLFVFFVWILNIKIFKIKEIPFFSDVRLIWLSIKKIQKKT